MVSSGNNVPIAAPTFDSLGRDQQPGRIIGKPELLRAAKHALRFDTAEFAYALIFKSLGKTAPGMRKRNLVAHLVVLRAANDLSRLAGCRRRPWQTLSRSAFGCCDEALICATTTLSKLAPRFSMPSISTPASVSNSASSSTSLGNSTNSPAS